MTPTKSSAMVYREICAPENIARLAPLVLPRSASRVCGLAAPVSAPTVRSTPVDGGVKAPFERLGKRIFEVPWRSVLGQVFFRCEKAPHFGSGFRSICTHAL